jgi:hypothetical protein
MTDEGDQDLETALKTPMNTTERSGQLRKDLKEEILESVSILNDISTHLKYNLNEKHLECEVKEGKYVLEVRIAAQPERWATSGGATPELTS